MSLTLLRCGRIDSVVDFQDFPRSGEIKNEEVPASLCVRYYLPILHQCHARWVVVKSDFAVSQLAQRDQVRVAFAPLCNSILPVVRGIDTVPTCSVRMTWPAAVTKSIHIRRRSLKSFLSLQRCREAHESRYQVSDAFSIGGKFDSVTIIAFATGPGVNGSESESSSRATAWWTLLGRLEGAVVIVVAF